MFLWGIGQPIWRSLCELVKRADLAEVLFTPMHSAPARHDVEPTDTVRWHSAVGPGGEPFSLPPHTVVTSRHGAGGRQWALVCQSRSPLDGCPTSVILNPG